MPKRYITRKRKRILKQRGGAGFIKSVINFFKKRFSKEVKPVGYLSYWQSNGIEDNNVYDISAENWLKEFMIAVELRNNPPVYFTEIDKDNVLQAIELHKVIMSEWGFNLKVMKFIKEMGIFDKQFVLEFLKQNLKDRMFIKNDINEIVVHDNQKFGDLHNKINNNMYNVFAGIDLPPPEADVDKKNNLNFQPSGGGSRGAGSTLSKYDYESNEFFLNPSKSMKYKPVAGIYDLLHEYINQGVSSLEGLTETQLEKMLEEATVSNDEKKMLEEATVSNDEHITSDEEPIMSNRQYNILDQYIKNKKRNNLILQRSVLQMPDVASHIKSFYTIITFDSLIKTLHRFDKQDIKLTDSQERELFNLREYFAKKINSYDPNDLNNEFIAGLLMNSFGKFKECIRLFKKYRFFENKDLLFSLMKLRLGYVYPTQNYIYINKPQVYLFFAKEFLNKNDVNFFKNLINLLLEIPLSPNDFEQSEQFREKSEQFHNDLFNLLTQKDFFSYDNFREIIKYLFDNQVIDETKKTQLEKEYAANNPEEKSMYSFVPHVPYQIDVEEVFEKYKKITPVSFDDIKVGQKYFFIPNIWLLETSYAGAVVVDKKDKDTFEIIYTDKNLIKVPIIILKETYGKEYQNRLFNVNNPISNLGGKRKSRRNRKSIKNRRTK